MKNQKVYEPTDKLINVISDNYSVLQSLGAFGINLGFGDKTVEEVCNDEKVDTYTFLAVVNYTVNGYNIFEDAANISVPTLIHYLKASHDYFLGYQLPTIRKKLEEALDQENNLAKLILKIYTEYEHTTRNHMQYEEKTVFPYVEALERHEQPSDYDVQTYSKHHYATDRKLNELKNIIIKYLPSDGLHNNQLTSTLYDIYNCEEWLKQHAAVEEHIFIPAVRLLEQRSRQSEVSMKIQNIIGKAKSSDEALSDREREVIIALVQGMTNKEIAEHLFISTNTVITHRRNIAKKLQIHSPAGLTIYAIVNNLVDISSVKL